MKKILLSAMALVAAMSVNAQVEIGVIDAEALGLSGDLVEVPAGTVISQTESVTVTTLFDDSFKSNSWSGSVKVGDQEATLSGMGLQGNTNGPGTAASEGTFPTQGCIYHFVANKDGYIYVFQKGSNNKNYVVFEEKARIPYVLTIDQGEDGVRGYDLSKIEGATVEDDGVVYIADDYAIQQVTVYTESTNNGTSVIKFPVYEGLEYDVLATGSKMSLGGFAFDTTGDATISFTTGGDEPKTTVLLENGYIPGADAPENPGEGTTIDPTNLIPNFTYCWNDAESVVANADGTLTFNSAAWGGVATWLGDDGVDFSAYKYVVFEFAEATTVATQPFIQYANGTANTTNWTAAGVTKAYAELDPAGASTVQQIACQTSDPTTLVITKIYLTNDDPNGSSVNPNPGEEGETVLWEGEALVNGWGNQPGFLSDGGAELTAAGAAVGDILRIYCSAPDDSWQVEFTEGHWGGMYFRYAPKDQGPEADGSERTYEIVDISNGYFDFVITEEFLTKATTQQWWGNVFLLNGDGNLTVTKVTLVKGGETSVQAVKAINTVDAIYNLAGQKVDASYKGIVIKGGKKFVVK